MNGHDRMVLSKSDPRNTLIRVQIGDEEMKVTPWRCDRRLVREGPRKFVEEGNRQEKTYNTSREVIMN